VHRTLRQERVDLSRRADGTVVGGLATFRHRQRPFGHQARQHRHDRGIGELAGRLQRLPHVAHRHFIPLPDHLHDRQLKLAQLIIRCQPHSAPSHAHRASLRCHCRRNHSAASCADTATFTGARPFSVQPQQQLPCARADKQIPDQLHDPKVLAAGLDPDRSQHRWVPPWCLSILHTLAYSVWPSHPSMPASYPARVDTPIGHVAHRTNAASASSPRCVTALGTQRGGRDDHHCVPSYGCGAATKVDTPSLAANAAFDGLMNTDPSGKTSVGKICCPCV